MARAARKTAPAPVEEETRRGGRTPDPVRYKMYQEWLETEKGIKHSAKALQDAIVHYHEFQRSDINKAYNAERREAKEAEAAERAERREARKAAGEAPRGRRKKAAEEVVEEVEETEEVEEAPKPKRRRAPRKSSASA